MTGRKGLKIAYLSIHAVDPGLLFQAAGMLEKDLGISVDYCGADYETLNEDPGAYDEFIRRVSVADFVLVRSMATTERFIRYDDFERAVRKRDCLRIFLSANLDLVAKKRDMFDGTDDEFRQFQKYTVSRMPENDESLFWCAARKLGLTDRDPPEPREPPTDGIYHPGTDRNIRREDYLKTLDPSKPTAGVLFSSYLWAYGNLDHIDALVECLESKGMNTIPVFTSLVVRNCLPIYFFRDGKPIVDVLVTATAFSHIADLKGEDGHSFFRERLNVPILYAISLNGEYRDFEQDRIGMSKGDIAVNAVYPELDGSVITVPIAYTPRSGGIKRAIPLPERIDHLSRLAYGWGTLRRKPASERRVAVIMWQSAPNSGVIGNAAGLDTPESVAEILRGMQERGYSVTGVPANSKEMMEQILDGVTNDLDGMSVRRTREKAAALVDGDAYRGQFSEMPEWDREMTRSSWGEPAGTIMVDGERVIIPGLIKGNVYVGYQPVRGWGEKMAEQYHDPVLFAQHQYVAFYKWLKHTFKADMMISMGTHGTLEWLPGKNMGMSEKCEPDLILDAIPNIYPYIIDDPGEGIQAKRRSESVLDGHMCPALARADSYEELDEINVQLQDYFKYGRGASPDRLERLVANIYEAARKNNLLRDLGITEETDPGPGGFGPYVIPLHDYLTEVKDALIRSDLHVLGRVPREGHFDEMLYSLTRMDNGDVPSLRDAFSLNQGVDMQAALDDPSGRAPTGETNADAVDRIDGELMDLLVWMRRGGYEAAGAVERLRERYGSCSAELERSLAYACGTVVPNIRRMRDEVDHLMDGMNGEFIVPGPSGAPTRGGADLLPMGRNYYGLNPDAIPSRTSWDIGAKMADQMIERYKEERGEYPREIGFVIWATDTMKTGGDDVAYLLWLMGVKPVWSRTGGRVTGLEVVPAKELGRPRIDVAVNITGLFRDTFPNLIDLIDDAVQEVINLDESDEENALAQHLREGIIEDIADGLAPDEARRRNSVRMFGAPPGGYGAGVNKLIASGEWQTVEDLARMYADYTSNGYSRGRFGVPMRKQFERRFGNVEVTVKNMPDRGIDLLDCDDVYQFLGGMNAYVRAFGKKDALTFMGDGSDPKRTKLRSTKEELRFVFRSKVLNPKFIDGLMEHGYRGAAEMANITEYTMAWGATSDIAEDWMYEGLADKFLFDEKVHGWMDDVNPYAIMNILNRLQEAVERGLWNATGDYKEKLRNLYIRTEERMEEITDRRSPPAVSLLPRLLALPLLGVPPVLLGRAPPPD